MNILFDKFKMTDCSFRVFQGFISLHVHSLLSDSARFLAICSVPIYSAYICVVQIVCLFLKSQGAYYFWLSLPQTKILGVLGPFLGVCYGNAPKYSPFGELEAVKIEIGTRILLMGLITMP